ETIKKDNTDAVTYTHDYGTTSGTYTVKIGGLATDYSDDEYTPAISFDVDIGALSAYSQAITEISGSLGAIFPTLSDGSQPRFPSLFYRAWFTEIPSGLFDGIHGAPVSNMFEGAFAGCYNLTSVPENLFAGITGNAPYMFSDTFSNCSNLTGIPENLFSGIVGSAPYMFSYTFGDCYDLTSIPENLFSGITGAAEGMFERTFANCSNLTGPSARINGKPLYELWPDNVADWGARMYEGTTGLDDYACIPTVMGGGGETCESAPEYKFSITISSSLNGGESWGFAIAAAGTFYVDWGDGNTEKIEKTDTQYKAYIHYYTFDNSHRSYTIRIGGLATAYSDDNSSTIDFSYERGSLITEINGSLGAVFPTLPDGSQPSFMGCFRNAKITEIPAELFDGIYGAPKEGMFNSTFNTNEKLVSIPETLFSGITGASEGVFAYTFHGCYALKSIPENLFSGITGNAQDMFSGTFAYCSNLTGPSARINGKYLYELWDEDPKMWGWDMYTDATGLDDYAYIPVIMGGLGQSREQLCTIGISQIKTSTGLAFALYAEKYTQPSMAIKYNNGICYGKLEQGNQSGTMNFNYNGVVYHLIN
ncbi:MAG: hypothetical protein J6R52_02245, partial [Alphaproteobacteria bacterium]|nr:hypothetical protein [Alphaproteobacteria bacterium]